MGMGVLAFRMRHGDMRQRVAATQQIPANLDQQGRKAGRQWQAAVEGFQLVGKRRVVAEGKVFGLRLEEEIEGIVHRHFGDEIHLNAEFARGFRKDQTGEVVRLRVLLPVDEMFPGRDLQGVTENRRAAVRGGAQPHHVRGKAHWPVMLVACKVAESDLNGHAAFPHA